MSAQRNLVFDVGIFDGVDIVHYLAKGFKVVGTDAGPRLVEKAKSRFKAQIQKNQTSTA